MGFARPVLTLRLACAAFAAAALGGCGCCKSPPPAYSKAEVNDSAVVVPTLRVIVPFGAPETSRGGGHAVEVRLAGVEGSDSQAHGSGAPIRIGGVSYTAPTTLRYDFDLFNAEAAYRYRKLWRAVGIEGLFGVGYNRVRLDVAAPGLRSFYAKEAIGPVASVGTVWQLRPMTSLQGRYSAWWSPTDNGSFTDLLRFEVFLVQALGKNLALRAGYTVWQFDQDAEGNYSDIRLRFAGPALGLDLTF